MRTAGQLEGTVQWLRVHVRRTILVDGSTETERSVKCPKTGSYLPFYDCGQCDSRFAVDHGDGETFVVCDQPLGRREDDESAEAPSVTVTDVMTQDVVCVRQDVPLDGLALLLLERGISGVPVVDEEGAPMGMVTKTDLLRALRGDTDPEEEDQGPRLDSLRRLTVAEVMTPLVLSLPEDATVERAAAVMSFEGVHHVPIVSSGGALVGMLSTIDIVRRMARTAGYVIPRHTRLRQPEDEPPSAR
jgi:CBS domain-containing protein